MQFEVATITAALAVARAEHDAVWARLTPSFGSVKTSRDVSGVLWACATMRFRTPPGLTWVPDGDPTSAAMAIWAHAATGTFRAAPSVLGPGGAAFVAAACCGRNYEHPVVFSFFSE